MRGMAAILATLLLAATLRAQDNALPDGVELVRDVVYQSVPGPDGATLELTFDAAFPAAAETDLPVAVYIHGGGYTGGSKKMGLPFALAFARGGYFAATIEYRLAGVAPYPAAFHDCQAAIRFLKTHAADLGIDAERIGVWGHSAGAHLAALVALSANDPLYRPTAGATDPGCAVRCVAEVSGPMDFLLYGPGAPSSDLGAWLGHDESTFERRARQASPLAYVDGNDPPVLIVHGDADRLVPIEHGKALQQALQAAGVSVDFHAVAGEGHAVRGRDEYVRIAAFFDSHLGGHSAAALSEATTTEPP